MNVLYFMEPKTNQSFGGVTTVAYNLPRALAKKIAIKYYPVFAPNIRHATSLLNIYRRLITREFDVVHFNVSPAWTQGGYSLFKLADITDTSTILNIHGIIQLEYSLYGFEKGSLNNLLLRIVRCCKIVDKIVTYSEFMRRRIITWYRVNPDKIVIIPNGVNISRFAESKSKLFLEGDPAILYLGHLSKSVDLLINAVSAIRSELPELKLHIVGNGDIAALKLFAKKKRVENRVVFHGPIASEETPIYYKAADFFVFPSAHTPAGITILEAMASGTAVIASNKGGTQEIITSGENGILFDPNNVASLPKAILAMHHNLKLRRRISQNALKTVKAYGWENIAEKYIYLYKSLRETRSDKGKM